MWTPEGPMHAPEMPSSRLLESAALQGPGGRLLWLPVRYAHKMECLRYRLVIQMEEDDPE